MPALRDLSLPIALALCAWSGAWIGACASGELPARTAHDPANPNAPESPWTKPSGDGPSGATMASTASSTAQPGMVYACPMGHGSWPAPGKCPVCGMTLVPRPAPSSSTAGSSSGSSMPGMPGMNMPPGMKMR